MKKFLLFILPFSFLLLVACTQEEIDLKENKTEQGEENQHVEKESELKNFFMKDGSEVEFKGEGNEFASFTAKTEWLNDRYVIVYEDNGGTVMKRIFRIDEDKIVVVQEEGEANDTEKPNEDQLDKMETLYIYLQLPLEKGATFDGWTVTDDANTLETPVQTFSNVITIEKENEDESITRKYFAEGFGEIKREFIIKEENQEFNVTSTIEKIK